MFREYIRQHPFLRFLLPLIIGIVLSNHLSVPNTLWYSSLFFAFPGILLFILIPKYQKTYSLQALFGVIVFVIFLAYGGIRLNDTDNRMQFSGINSGLDIVGVVKQEPVEKRNSIACVCRIQGTKRARSWSSESGLLMLYLQKDARSHKLKVGDRLLLQTEIRKVKNTGNPCEFDYAAYLKTQHILYSGYVDSLSWRYLGQDQEFSLKKIGYNWRNQLLTIYKKNGIRGDNFDILAALTLGYKSGIDPEIKKAWADAGAMHVLAVSGLHVGVIYLVMSFVLRFLEKRKKGAVLKGIALLFVLWAYACLTGMSPSVMRSASMFSFIVIGEMIKRKGSVYNSLAISAFFLLLIDPYLLYTVGFQFSYLAVLSIVYFQPRFDKLIYINNPVLKKIWQLTSVSLSAQIGTFPLTIYYFHQFPSYFLLSGYIVISMAAILIYLSAALLIFSKFDLISNVLGWMLQNMVDFMNYSIIKIQNLPGAVIRDISFSQNQLGLLYVGIFSVALLIIHKKKKAIFGFLIVLIAFQMPDIFKLFRENKKELLVFNSKKHTIIGFVENDKAVFLVDKALSVEKRDKLIWPYIRKNALANVRIDTIKPFEIKKFGSKTISIIGNRNMYQKEILKDAKSDILIVRSRGLPTKNLLTKEYSNCHLILDASVHPKDRQMLLTSEALDNINVFDVQEDGAFICSVSNKK